MITKKTKPPQIGTIIAFLFLYLNTLHSENKLTVYPSPNGVELNSDFTVKVRQDKREWMEIPVYTVKVQKVEVFLRTEEKASMSYFDFSGEVEISVTYNKGKISTSQVRPLSYNITPEIDSSTLIFKLNKPHNLSVEVNGDIYHNLHLFANPLEDFKPGKNTRDVIFFGPGIHNYNESKFTISSDKTVYVAGGAVLMGPLRVINAENVKIIGRGMVDSSVKMGIAIENSKNVLVEGIFSTQCATGGSNNVTIRNVKTISYFGWGDGMNVFASNNVLFNGVFCRNSDDCTTVYGTRKGFVGGCKNITMQNSTLWADVAHPILIGTHGNTVNPEYLENLKYSNIDIIDHNEMQVDYQGCMSLNAGDSNFIRDVTFENIRVENFRRGQLVNLRVFYNSKYCTSPGRGIENVLFKNISYNGKNAELSIISGYDENRKIRNIIFENLVINGQLITDDMPEKPKWYKTADIARFYVGEHVENIRFVK